MQENIQRYEEDEIDLRELWKTLMKRKMLIAVVTVFITAAAVGYVLLKTPMYQAKALLEIGNYKLSDSNSNSMAMLDNASQLTKRLNVLYIDMYEGVKGKDTEVTSIAAPKNQNNFIEIKTLSLSNTKAKEEIEKVLTYIQSEHQKILDDVKRRRELEIKNIEVKINDIKTKELALLNDNINLKKKDLKSSENELKDLSENLSKIKKTDTSFIALNLMQKRDLTRYISELESGIIDLQNQKNLLETTTINKLIEDKTLIASMLLPYNYKNTAIVGSIMTNDYPVKPKKKLIVAVAFVTGLLLSVFLAFFLEFVSGMKEEEA